MLSWSKPADQVERVATSAALTGEGIGLKLVSLIAASATAMGETVLTALLTTVTGLAGVLLTDINAPGQLQIEGVYQIPLAMRDSKRGGARDHIIDTANAVNSDGSRKYQLDIKLDTLVSELQLQVKDCGSDHICR